MIIKIAIFITISTETTTSTGTTEISEPDSNPEPEQGVKEPEELEIVSITSVIVSEVSTTTEEIETGLFLWFVILFLFSTARKYFGVPKLNFSY